MTLADIAAVVGGDIDGNPDTIINGLAPIESAGPGMISFVANKKYVKFIATTSAAALILDPATPCPDIPALRHADPYLTFARVMSLFHPLKRVVQPGIDKSSVVGNNARVEQSAGVGPLCHIGQDVHIGTDTQLVSSVYVGSNVTIGSNCLLYPGVRILDDCVLGDNVTLHPGVVIGSDGFGYAASETGPFKIPQVGNVEIGSDVEIGANTTIDRGAIGPTRIGRGTKIDNLVQVGHNVQIGDFCIIVAQVGIAGSVVIEDRVTLAGKASVAGHIEVGHDAIIAAHTLITKSVAPGETMLGNPGRLASKTRRIEAALRNLPEIVKRLRKVEEKLSDS